MPGLRRFPLPLIAAFFALYVIWGSTYLVIRIGVEYWPPLLLAGIRFVIAGTLMYAFLRWRGAPAPTWAQWKAAGIIGILLLSCGNGAVSIAEHTGVASGVAALAVATVPLFTLLCGYFWGARNTRLEWAGIVLGLIGIGMLNLGSNLQSSPTGAALLVFAAAAWAFGSVWSRHLPLPQGAMASAVEMLVGGVVLLIGSAVSGERLESLPPVEGWVALAYLIFFGSIIAFNAYMYLLKNVRPAAATSYAYVNPAVAVLLGIVFVGETIGIEEALAMAVIISAVVLIGLPQWRRAPVKPAAAVPTESRVN
ncbi:MULTISPECIES: drug/metabolite exporter YedA [unclassified Pseudomonas]|jgi:drug/metabolite transporter (DMT)-like permease|uniref:drug/metabolite exporter YedA n=1 Tax=unclassified Pseudomonas TaxID=196821 RepID=UPI0013919372|nr:MULTISPECIES: drug/metabolite exporter YedA [unclassified Pseudomonas]MBH1967476.1 drug/metabolite exporter YedA [Pseudomonadales bacterium]KAI2673804.1 drug/metabolite exporter YedA [Pseudomonas sp. TNT3]MBF4558815.1 drug/metabolite exporter YedA [Pseudomonas sp. p50(2008)]MBH2037899.1 drug/metabolite exporter YedA [Pseudomonadales bacterium]MBH2074923.1 drug/metabolite exporter YedA [Pseudomonadales bacterium]